MPETESESVETLVIGAGIGGLAAALTLAGQGREVLVLEAADRPGGKMRTLPSAAGPVDAGPTVFTLRRYFEALFEAAGARLSEHVRLVAEPMLARHYWPDGDRLDLFADAERSAGEIRAFAGPGAEAAFRGLMRDAGRLFRAFERPMMLSARPSYGGIARGLVADPGLAALLMPGRTLWRDLCARFADRRLAQLFARYATYVGGSPFRVPALLMLIWEAEARGVWRVEGGMHALAEAVAALAQSKGARFRYGAPVAEILVEDGRAAGAVLASGARIRARNLVFNGDPAALGAGLLGAAAAQARAGAGQAAGRGGRALSAYVWAFAAEASGVELAHHTVFFNREYRAEFDAIARGAMPEDATLYICAEDRGTGRSAPRLERFEIIMNGPAQGGDAPALAPEEEYARCRSTTFTSLAERGLSLTPWPGHEALTTPAGFAARFPGSAGSLYGQSPEGMMAAFRRPVAKSPLPGLYLAGGGVHPGAGVPMAMLSGRRAGEAILAARASTSGSMRTAMPGGMSTASPTTAAARSRSSAS